jgi:hypothetical protein
VPTVNHELCAGCEEAIELDQVAIISLDDAQPAIIACDKHLRRLVLALEVLDALEQAERFTIPPLVDVAYTARLKVNPERRS